MAEPGKRTATYADIVAAPEHLVAEIIHGELVTRPRQSFRHGVTTTALAARLSGAFQFRKGGPGGWFFFPSTEVKLDSDIVVPDIAGWRRDRLSTLPETNYLTVAPDWVCEVLSASTERRDRTVKKRIYAEAGVSFLWIVDPREQTLEAFALQSGGWTQVGTWRSDDIVSAPPFDAISFSLADLWPLDRPLGLNEDPQPLYAGDR